MCDDIGLCCGGADDDCAPSIVEGDMVCDACDDVIDVVEHIRESVVASMADTNAMFHKGDNLLRNQSIASLTIFVGELVQALVQYDDPDPGMEPLE